jgi:hypothetical protein
MQKFWQKSIHSPFLDFGLERLKKAKRTKSPHPPHEKFGILNETKHIQENFGILYFIISK